MLHYLTLRLASYAINLTGRASSISMTVVVYV